MLAIALALTIAGASGTGGAAPSGKTVLGPLDRGGVPANVVPGRALVKMKGIDAHRFQIARENDGAAKTALADLAHRHGVTIDFVRPVVLGWALVEIRDASDSGRMPSEAQTEKLVDRLVGDAAVDAASVEHWWRHMAVPNDPGMPQMWHFDAIGAQSAWDITVGNTSQRIGVADTGLLLAHEDVGNRAVNGFDFVSDSFAANDGGGRDSNFNNPGDSCEGEPSSFHGTHVAGTIGASADNGVGVAGLNWGAGLVFARVLGRCGGSDVDIMEGAAWLAGAHIDGVPDVGADRVSVMNLSLGGANACSSFDQQVVDFVDGEGTIFVAAAGNDAGPVGSPANCSRVVTVAAFGPDGAIAGYSSFGSEVEIVGPGGDGSAGFGQAGEVLSSIGPTSDDYAFLEGTSMATPHVVGAISLLQSVTPNLTRAQIVTALQAGGQVCTGCGTKPMLNIPASLASIGATAGTAPPPPPPPAPTGAEDDVFEENDDMSTATAASCGVDDDTLIASPGDLDVFTITPPAGRKIAVEIHAANGADLDLYVTSAAGEILARSESTTGDERITGATSGRTLGILVNPFVDDAGFQNTGPYRLVITCGQQATAVTQDFVPGDANDDVNNEVDDGVDLGDPSSAPPPSDPGSGVGPGDGGDGTGGDVGGGGDSGGGATLGDAIGDKTLPHAPKRPDVKGGCSSSGSEPAALALIALVGVATIRRRRRG